MKGEQRHCLSPVWDHFSIRSQALRPWDLHWGLQDEFGNIYTAQLSWAVIAQLDLHTQYAHKTAWPTHRTGRQSPRWLLPESSGQFNTVYLARGQVSSFPFDSDLENHYFSCSLGLIFSGADSARGLLVFHLCDLRNICAWSCSVRQNFKSVEHFLEWSKLIILEA